VILDNYGSHKHSKVLRWLARSIVELQAAINRFIEAHNHDPKPFVWTADPRAYPPQRPPRESTLETIH
jgi:hypothetical protein